MILLLLLLAMCLAAAGLAWRMFAQNRGEPMENRVALAAAPLLVALVVLLVARAVISTPGRDWNACRVAPSVALFQGYKLYYGPDDGPILNTLYAPMTAVVFTPAALGTDPTAAILIAGTINAALVVLPMFLLLWLSPLGGPRDSLSNSLRWLAFVFAAGAVFEFSGTDYILSSIHADAPAIGFTLLACLVLMRTPGEPSNTQLALAALLAAMACWSKQIEVFALPGMFFFVGFAFSWRSAFVFAVMVGIFGVVLLAAFSGLFGFDAMWFNIVTLPGRHPWIGSKGPALVKSFVKLALGAAFVGLVIAPFVLGAGDTARRSLADLRSTLASRRWLLLVFVAVTMLPGSLMGQVKIGGFVNSYHSGAYLIAAAALALLQWAAMTDEGTRRSRLTSVFVLSAFAIGLGLPRLPDLAGARGLWNNPQQEAYEFARAHPGQVFLPWNSLSSLYADRKLHHFEYGVYDRVIGGHAPTEEHVRKFVPADMQYLVFRAARECFQLPRYLKEFSEVTHVARLKDPLQPIPPVTHDPNEPPELADAGLGGWLVYRKPAK